MACISSISSSSIRPPRASSADGALRIRAMTASSWSSALSRAAQDVGALLGLAQQVPRAPDDDLDLVVDVVR